MILLLLLRELKMASRVGAVVSLVVLVWAMSSVNVAEAKSGLVENFYAKTCPQFEQVVYKYVSKLYYSPLNNTAISMVRWSFHDFFNVRTYIHSNSSKFSPSIIIPVNTVYGPSWSNY